MEVRVETIEDVETESKGAKAYWAQPGTQPLTYSYASHYAVAIAETFKLLGCSRFFEFGCAAGRNIQYVLEHLKLHYALDATGSGIDINQESVSWGRENLAVDVRVGDENFLEHLDDNSFDSVFTVSVLDHIPTIDGIVKNMLRLSSKFVLIVEPVHPEGLGGKVTRIANTWGDHKGSGATPFTYVHDYRSIFSQVGANVVVDIPFPTHLNNAGPLYRMFILEKTGHSPRELGEKIEETISTSALLQLLKVNGQQIIDIKRFQSTIARTEAKLSREVISNKALAKEISANKKKILFLEAQARQVEEELQGRVAELDRGAAEARGEVERLQHELAEASEARTRDKREMDKLERDRQRLEQEKAALIEAAEQSARALLDYALQDEKTQRSMAAMQRTALQSQNTITRLTKELEQQSAMMKREAIQSHNTIDRLKQELAQQSEIMKRDSVQSQNTIDRLKQELAQQSAITERDALQSKASINRLEQELDRLAKIKKRDTASFGATIDRIKQQLVEKTRDSQVLEKRLDQSMQKLSATTNQSRRLQQELDEIKQRNALEKQKSAQRILALESRLRILEESISYRFGSAVVDTVRTPRNFPRFIRTMSGLYREYRHRDANTEQFPLRMPEIEKPAPAADKANKPSNQAPQTPVENESVPQEDLLRIARDSGTSGIIEHISNQFPKDSAAKNKALIAASRTLLAQGIFDGEFNLLKEAVALEKSDTSLRALYWAAQRRGEYMTAWECLRDIEKLYGQNPTQSQRLMLEKLRRGPAYELSLLAKVPSAPLQAVDAVPGRLCYVIHNSLPFSSGGYATRAHGLARGLKGVGFDVVVLTRPGFPFDIKHDLDANDVPEAEEIDGLAYQRLFSPRRSGRSALDYMVHAADALTSRLAEMRPEIVVAASNYLTAFPAMIAARRLGIPFFYEVRGFWEITRISREPEFESTASYKVQRLMESELAKAADHVFTLTTAMHGELVERGVPADKITLLPNSFDPNDFDQQQRDTNLAAKLDIPAGVPVIGYVGTFVQYEGLDLLVEAAAHLRRRSHDFRLLLVGNENASGQDMGPLATMMKRIAAEQGLDEWLIMPGRVPYEEVAAYYSLIDIAPFPRKAQPVTELVSPMKPLEAFAMKKAVVVSSVRALSEMVQDGTTGVIFEKDNVISLADALEKLILDQDLRTRLGAAGRRWVESTRTWDITANQAALAIRQTLGANREEHASSVAVGSGLLAN